MVYVWDNQGNDLSFKDWDTFLLRARYRGQSGTEGVSMWSIDGRTFFYKDLS